MEGTELTEASYEKDLGVCISADMKCSKQCIMYAVNKATKVFGYDQKDIQGHHGLRGENSSNGNGNIIFYR